MCGIAGWIDWEKDFIGSEHSEKEVMTRMSDVQAHRGPDAKGEWRSSHAYLVHRRLIVIDPVGGGQPMIRNDQGRKYVIVYNGELYNTTELRNKLRTQGYKFNGHSDTEVLLSSYIEWGKDCLTHLNGIFAFAVWDEARQELFLARDRMGVKPLFYSVLNNGLLFASEIKALLVHAQVRSELNLEGLSELLLLGPGRTPGHGIFTGIKELFVDSVSRQLVSDVLICTLLSGGLDSSAITSVASPSIYQTRGEILHTYSVDFVENDRFFQKNSFQPDLDAHWVDYVSKYLKTQHHYIFLDHSDLIKEMDQALYARDLPGMADIRNLDLKLSLLSPELRKKISPETYIKDKFRDAVAETPLLPDESLEDQNMRKMFYLNITRWMPTLLERKDRMSMYTGLEIRVPFCDHRLVEYAYNIPWSVKNYEGKRKGILRAALKGILPEAVRNRPKNPYPKTFNPKFITAAQKLILDLARVPDAPLFNLISRKSLQRLAESKLEMNQPWFGQLMRLPQLFIYLTQLNTWLKHYRVKW